MIVPTYQGDEQLDSLLRSLAEQTVRVDEIIVAETDARGPARSIAEKHGAVFVSVARSDFDHAGTRSALAVRATGQRLLFLSQDVRLEGRDAVATLLAGLDAQPNIVGAFGRQLPGPSESEFSRLKRSFNYPSRSTTRGWSDRETLGYRAAFLSNAFAVYRRSALEAVGWFGERIILCEDVAAGASLLARGGRIAYVAEAVVVHHHRATRSEERRRYFDIGVAHHQLSSVLAEFGRVNREGFRFLRFGMRELVRRGRPWRIPVFITWTVENRIAYALGRRHDRLPRWAQRRLSGCPHWWTEQGQERQDSVDPPEGSSTTTTPINDQTSGATLSSSK